MEEENKNNILVIDDEPANIISLTHILKDKYKIHAAKNGADGIRLAHKYMPDVILLDIIMPDMDGFEVISELKNNAETKGIPVIFITGLTNVEDEAKGLLAGAADYINKPFSAPIVELRVNNQVMMQNYIKKIEELSVRDQLTGLTNRRGFDERLRSDYDRAKRNQAYISVMIMDLDKFKKYNDTYGHLQGDKALQAAAKVLENTVERATDFIGRWGGEEFVALLSDNDGEHAKVVAERIRKNMEAIEIPLLTDGSITKITVSIGICSGIPNADTSADIFMNNADSALYLAKENGRNQFVLYDWGK
ncbi:MAG: diguanylate cyclase [Lachnospiraceae bacterium]|nr:diguanylate cyclase [Lachnospiraceae bacterium]